jgi:hypothetical protein
VPYSGAPTRTRFVPTAATEWPRYNEAAGDGLVSQ